MQAVGIDIGSRTIKTVVSSARGIEHWEVVDATSRPASVAQKMLARYKDVPVMATGYGRDLLEVEGIPSVTEIKACAQGVHSMCNDARVVVDIGGQDLKVIELDKKGKIAKFEMNDRCAAGTGKFLEIMAEKLEIEISSFGEIALLGGDTVTISSLCTVFAESEVIGLLNRNIPREDIACAIHKSAVRKLCGMYKRVASSTEFPIYLVGGGALNSAIKVLLEKQLNVSVLIPDSPQIIIALGASLLAAAR